MILRSEDLVEGIRTGRSDRTHRKWLNYFNILDNPNIPIVSLHFSFFVLPSPPPPPLPPPPSPPPPSPPPKKTPQLVGIREMIDYSPPSLDRDYQLTLLRNRKTLLRQSRYGPDLLPFIAVGIIRMVHTISHNLSSNTALDTLKFAAFQRQLLLFFTGIDYAARWNKSHPDEDCQVTEVIARSLLEKAKVLSRVGSGEERDRMNGMAGLAEGIMYEWPPAAGWVSTSFDGSYGPIWSPQPGN